MDYKWDIDFGLVPIPILFKSKYPVLFQLSCSILDIPSEVPIIPVILIS